MDDGTNSVKGLIGADGRLIHSANRARFRMAAPEIDLATNRDQRRFFFSGTSVIASKVFF